MKNLYFIAIFYCTIIISSCSRDQNNELEQSPSLTQVFDQFYEFMDEHYVFWDLDPTDWDKMYYVRAQFQDLDINNQQDRVVATELFHEMTKDILDHHFTIDFIGNGIRGLQINPALERKQLTNIPSYFDSIEEVESMIRDEKKHGQYNSDSHFLTGQIDDSTVIFKANILNFRRNHNSGVSPESDQSLNWFFDVIEKDETKQVILDLRSCSGGDILDLNFFLGKLISDDLIFGYTKFKIGRLQTNYTPLIPATLKSRRINKNHTPEINILTNTMTASLAEIISYIVQSNNLGSIIGSKTYGAMSPISDFDVFNSGTIPIGDFMQVRTASVQFLGLNKQSLEGLGIIPNSENLLKR